ncbi:hypothetical protein [Peptostreptococcus porci]|uniref:hypothetical protein n=1 Tax=Peptostreptococcus porci TaxID=2652282 RepID=UPI002A7FD9D7|nr:hypothetical protein [Peptostreptococcus porci]MDY4128667.1 hypothetical protein [Peptostreptococcus porci]
MIDKISKYIEENNIIIDECELLKKYGKAALYCCIENKNIILLHPDFEKRSKNEQIEILAEECGHYATSSGDTFIVPDTSLKKLNIDKSEHKAFLWGCKYFIDEDDLIKYLRISTSVEELTDYLGATDKMLYEYLYSLKNKMQFFDLQDGTFLDLYKLPNIVIIDKEELYGGVDIYEEP